jgi:hypothetical protein
MNVINFTVDDVKYEEVNGSCLRVGDHGDREDDDIDS